MENNFENELKKHGDAYKVQPREWVWPRVEAELDKKKERRIAAWWWMLPLFLLMLGTGYWAMDSKKLSSGTAITTTAPNTAAQKQDNQKKNTKAGEKSNLTTATEPTGKLATTVSAATKEIDTTAATMAVSKGKKEPSIEKERPANTLTASSSKNAMRVAKKSIVQDNADNGFAEDFTQQNSTSSLDKKAPSKKRQDLIKSINTKEKSLPTENILASGGQAKKTEYFVDTLPADDAANQITINKNTTDPGIAKDEGHGIAHKQSDSAEINNQTIKEAGIPNIAPKTKQAFNKETVWTINAGIGRTNNKNGLGLSNLFSLEQKMYDNLPQNSANPGNGSCQSCNANTLPLVSSTAGINLNLSVARTQWLNNRWLWQAELGWQYQQMHQRYGGRKDSAIFYSNLSSAAFSYYYQSGSTATATGSNHRLYISNQIVFAMLKNRGLRLSVGLYGGWNISNSYLIPDRANFRFVDSKNLYSKGFMGGEAGIKYVLKNNWLVGVNGKVDFTRSFTPPDGNKQYWKSWQLQAGVPISIIKHVFKK